MILLLWENNYGTVLAINIISDKSSFQLMGNRKFSIMTD